MFNKLGKKVTIIIIALVAVSFLAGFWAGYDYKAAEIRKAFTDAFSNTGDDSSTDTSSETPAQKKFVTHGVDETVDFGAYTAKLVSVKTAQSISSEYSSPVNAKDGTKFIIAEFTINNTTKSQFMFEPFSLYDDKDRQYEDFDETIGNIDNYLAVRDIPPSIAETGVIVYQVPNDVKEVRIGTEKGDSEVHVFKASVQ